MKTLAAFLNSQGGTLLIGVRDDGKIVGLAGRFQVAVRLGQLVLEQFVAQRGANARPQLGDVVRFGDVIHRAKFETAELVGRSTPGG